MRGGRALLGAAVAALLVAALAVLPAQADPAGCAEVRAPCTFAYSGPPLRVAGVHAGAGFVRECDPYACSYVPIYPTVSVALRAPDGQLLASCDGTGSCSAERLPPSALGPGTILTCSAVFSGSTGKGTFVGAGAFGCSSGA